MIRKSDGSGGHRLLIDDAARIREALPTFGPAAERPISAVHGTRALADGVAYLGLADVITNANDHSAPLESQASAIATDYQ